LQAGRSLFAGEDLGLFGGMAAVKSTGLGSKKARIWSRGESSIYNKKERKERRRRSCRGIPLYSFKCASHPGVCLSHPALQPSSPQLPLGISAMAFFQPIITPRVAFRVRCWEGHGGVASLLCSWIYQSFTRSHISLRTRPSFRTVDFGLQASLLCDSWSLRWWSARSGIPSQALAKTYETYIWGLAACRSPWKGTCKCDLKKKKL
jgi:hypothetical protein